MRFISTFLIVCWFGIVATASAAQTAARLVLAQNTARPGDTVLAGVHLHMAAGWHTYWKNPGASGMATKIEWQLPAGITAGEIQWPVPDKLPEDDLTTYTYHDDVVLLVPLKLTSDLKPGPLELKAHVSWLECKELCLPGSGDVQATLTVGSQSQPSPDAQLIQTWQSKIPGPLRDWTAKAWWEKAASGDTRPLILALQWPQARDKWIEPQEVDFFPDASDAFEVEGPTEKVSGLKADIGLRKRVKKLEAGWPKEVTGILVLKTGGDARGFEVKLPVTEKATQDAGRSAAPFSWAGLLGALGAAFVGGLILNIMPCVLPVIALKIFSFVKQSGEEPRRARQLGLIYALGILASFLALAGFLIALQKAGHVVSWGVQMQNRNFVIGMTILVTLVALNLFGLFEVTLGGGAMGAASALTARSGPAGAFFNGLLATALAIPCTAPVLTYALAFAFGQPPGIIVLTFCFIALGLAGPYIVLTWNPALLRFLPKPGPWMQRFKVALGFPMLATVVWLYKISLNHLSKSQALWFGIFLVTLAAAAWIWGEFVQGGTRRRGLAAAISLLLVASVGGYAATRSEGLKWQPWSQAAVEKARKEGRPVLVDFTADWCLTCQVNLRTSIDTPRVRAKLAEINAATLLGDYTVPNETVGQELHRFGRDAVPLVVVFPKSPAADPIILPPVLTPQTVIDALDRAAK